MVARGQRQLGEPVFEGRGREGAHQRACDSGSRLKRMAGFTSLVSGPIPSVGR
jgi:hypothetical protein